MPCDTMRRPNETVTQRKQSIRDAVARLAKGLANGTIKPIVGREGAIAFQGWSNESRDRVTDACAYRRLMVEGSGLAKAAIMKAEALAGRSVNKQALANGVHSHDFGKTWHHGH